ncbi:MAG: C40 family peptidase [Panacagrimonas sp.]
MTRTLLACLLLGLNLCLGTTAAASDAPLQLNLTEQIDVHRLTPAPQTPSPQAVELKLDPEVRASLIEKIVLSAGQSLLGTDYVLGANDAQAVDCSSLMQRIFRRVGLNLPRTAREQAVVGVAVKAADIEPGDLLFYRWGKRGLHVAVYLPGDQILHASTSRREVVVTTLNPDWNKRLVSARRLL